jgi:hypothetical protein
MLAEHVRPHLKFSLRLRSWFAVFALVFHEFIDRIIDKRDNASPSDPYRRYRPGTKPIPD